MGDEVNKLNNENDLKNTEIKKYSQKDTESKSSKFVKKIKGIKNIEIIIAVLAVLIMLVIYFTTKLSAGSSSKTNGSVTSTDIDSVRTNYCLKMENDLNASLSTLKGAGNTRVVINWESSVEMVIAYITNTGSSSSTSTPQIISSNGSQTPIILKEIYPKALGVIIFCQGGNNVSVKLDIINAVSILLDITPDKISVFATN